MLAEYRADAPLIEEIDYLNHCLTRDIPKEDLPEKIPPFIAEHLVDINTTIEYCYEGTTTGHRDRTGRMIEYTVR